MLKTILKFSVSNIVNLILGVLSAVVLTRLFTPEVYGVINVFNVNVATGLSILYIGLDSSFIRFYNEPPRNESSKQLGTKLLFICLFCTAVVGTAIVLLAYKPFSIYIFGFESRLICGMMVVSIFAQIILRFLNIKYRMEFKTRSFTIQAVLTQISLKFIVIIAAILSLPIHGIISFNALGVFILAIIYLVIQRKSFFSFDGFLDYEAYSPVFLFAVLSAPVVICINLNVSLTQQIITHFLDYAAVGIYSSAGYFASILSALQGGFATFWSAYMYGNYKEKQDSIGRVNEYLLLVIIVVFGMLILSKDLVYLLIGEQYQSSKQFFSLCLLYPILMLASETTTYGISIRKKTYLSLLCFTGSTAINLFLAYLFVPAMGLKGAALASAISSVVLYVSRTCIGQKLYKSISSIRYTVLDVTIIVFMAVIPAYVTNIVSNTVIMFLILLGMGINMRITKDMIGHLKALIRK